MSSLPHQRCDNFSQDENDNKNDDSECRVSLPQHFDSSNTFDVTLERNGLGLGFSISGGPSAAPPWTGLVRVKTIFPLQPAWLDGRLRCGDVLVKVGNVRITGLPLQRALDVLRSGPSSTVLSVYRPCARHQELDNARLCQTVARSRSFTPATHHGLSLNLSAPLSLSFHTEANACKEVASDEDEGDNEARPVRERPTYGQFTVQLVKVRGSLGFSLNRDDEKEHSVLRHSVKALLREPALTDGRIRPGDKLISANGTSCDGFTHAELVAFLRGCPDAVTLVLYRDDSRAQTPASPTENGDAKTDFSAFYPRHKQLRYEAKEMVRSLQASRTSLDGSPGGSIASSVGSGMLFRRGFSPHRRVRAMSGGGGGDGPSAPLSIFESSAPPTVEFPVSPTEDEYRSLPALVQERLQIEELTASTMEED